jgi:hypothetical protein
MPGLSNVAAVPTAWLNVLIGAADSAVKTYCKRDLELGVYTEYYSGNGQLDIVCKQYPVLSATTTISLASDGVALPTPTINVTSTRGFHPGTGGNPNADPPGIAVQTGPSTWTTVTYTGTTATSFTGCAGGVGTLSASGGTNPLNGVATPAVYYDPNGCWGQRPGGFGPGTQMIPGNHYAVVLDSKGRKSNRGLIRRVGGFGSNVGGFGHFSETWGLGKLAAQRLPSWPRGDGDLKVYYAAGYEPGRVPYDLQHATAMLAAYLVRVSPTGSPLSSESLGSYSYSVLSQSNEIPEIGSVQRILAQYRETSWGL